MKNPKYIIKGIIFQQKKPCKQCLIHSLQGFPNRFSIIEKSRKSLKCIVLYPTYCYTYLATTPIQVQEGGVSYVRYNCIGHHLYHGKYNSILYL